MRAGLLVLTVARPSKVVQFFMGLSILVAASRQMWAFSRDGALPFSSCKWEMLCCRLAGQALTPGPLLVIRPIVSLDGSLVMCFN